MIKGYCRTSIDDVQRLEWPKRFVAIPNFIRALNAETTLKVHSVTHCQAKANTLMIIEVEKGEPFIIVDMGWAS